jgi:hypothetical protein
LLSERFAAETKARFDTIGFAGLLPLPNRQGKKIACGSLA